MPYRPTTASMVDPLPITTTNNGESKRRDDALDRIIQMFNHSPFTLLAEDAHNDVESMCYFNEERESADLASTLASELGTKWVDSLIGTNPSIAKICQAQIELFRSFPVKEVSNLERTLSALPTDASQSAIKAQAEASENSEALLEEMSEMVDSSLRRETSQIYSVAFCGTVKAG